MTMIVKPHSVDYIDFTQAAKDAGVSVREDYSGRGMFGRSCVGVVHENLRDLLTFFTLLAVGNDDLAEELAGVARQDNMGHDTITYFPGVEVTS